MDSLWTRTAQLPHFGPLRGTHRTDVLVIGGGLTGLLTAHHLAQAGVDCLLVEADRIAFGTTAGTTAKITALHRLCYAQMIRRYGRDRARLYLEANQRALAQYRRMCQGIDCDYQEQDAFVYALDNRQKIDQELAALQQLGAAAAFSDAPELPFPVAGAVRMPAQAQFHPLKFARAIAGNLRIYEGVRVLEIAPGKAVTDGGVIHAHKIIVATHFPILNRHGSYFMKLHQHRSWMLALENAPTLQGMYVDEAEGGLSLRGHPGGLLLGGQGCRTGSRSGGWRALEAVAGAYYPQARIAGRWAAQDCMSLDGIPYIGQYSGRTPGLYVATGFNKWGMTSAMVAASLLTDLVLGRENPLAQLYSPSRSILHPQLLLNAAHSAISLLTPTAPRCSHMGCALKYNRAEHSWDCPCHGSRFTREGSLLEPPAIRSMRRAGKT